MNWEIFSLPFDESYLNHLSFTSPAATRPGNFFKGEFQLDQTGDTYLDVSKWEKGVVWVNGHNLGRYWNIGPQQRLYCPAPWLKKGNNELIIFDLHQLIPKPVKGERTLE
jgi:beta-galactosidase GanA